MLGLLGLAWIALLAGCRGTGAEHSTGAAAVYEDYYVPALFEPWAVRVADAAAVKTGDRVLDVACGTGIVAREIARRIGPADVVGLDIDEDMLAVAENAAPGITWRQGDAQALPFPDDSFDVVTCQFGLMFFDDPVRSIREMQRVARPGGRVVVAVWGPLEKSPGYADLARLIEREIGIESAAALHQPFSLGDTGELRGLFTAAGVREAQLQTSEGHARFPSLRSWAETEIRGWVALSESVGQEELDRLIDAAERELVQYCTPDGHVEIPIQAHLVHFVAR